MDVRPAGSAERRDLHLDADRPCIDRIAGRMMQSEGTNGVSDWSERFEVSIDGAWTGIFTRLEFAYSNDVERERGFLFEEQWEDLAVGEYTDC